MSGPLLDIRAKFKKGEEYMKTSDRKGRKSAAKEGGATALLIGAGLAAAAGTADASIVYQDLNITLSSPNTLSLDVDNNGSADFNFYKNDPYSLIVASVNYFTDGPLAAGASIGNTTPWSPAYQLDMTQQASHTTQHLVWKCFPNPNPKLPDYCGPAYETTTVMDPWSTGPWAGVNNGFLGLLFSDGNGQAHYGWLDVDVPFNGGDVLFNGLAYETTPDTAILAGAKPTSQVPEPSSILLLAAGAGAVAGYRRMRGRKRVG